MMRVLVTGAAGFIGSHLSERLAAEPGISSAVPFEVYARNNITATFRLLEAALRSRTLRGFVYVSTSSVYGVEATGDETTAPAPTSSYGVTKLAAEQLVLSHARDHGFPVCSLRLFSVYGPRERPEKLCMRLIGSVLEAREFPLFEGSERHVRGYTYVGDVVEGLARQVAWYRQHVLGKIDLW